MAEPKHSQRTRGAVPPGYELRDFRPKNIVLFAVALSAIIVVVLLVSYALFSSFANIQARSQTPPSPLASTRQPAPGPRLQVDPAKDIQEMRAAEDATLDSYGWVNPKAGIVRIPIDRAIDLLAERGLPARTKTEEQKRGAGIKEQQNQAGGETSKDQRAK